MSQNKNIVVLYRSKSGFTKTYATWIAEALGCDLLEGSKINADELVKYDTIIYGGGLYAIHINGFQLISKNLDKFKNKKIIAFAVGSSPAYDETVEQIRQVNIPAEYRDNIRLFYLRGGFDYSRLDRTGKLLMSMLKVKLKNTKNPTADEKGLLESYDHPQDFTDKKNIEPLLKYAEA